MGGPACGLIIPEGTQAVAEAAALRMARAINCRPVDWAAPTPWRYLDAADTTPIGGRPRGRVCPLHCGQEPWEYDAIIEDAVFDEFGFIPDPVPWSFGSFINANESHRVLADVAAYMAEATGGVIDFGSTLPAARELPGVARTAYNSYTARPYRTLLDAVAMRAWSRRPDCWMVK